MANNDPGRQPFEGNCTANSTAVDSGFGQIGPVPAKKRLVVESVSAELVTSTSGALYTMVATTGDAGQGTCYVSGYFLDT